MEAGKYYWVSKPDGSEKCLVYCYVNPDFQDGTTLGIGFNIADGGGWVPLWDVPRETVFKELKGLGI